MPKHNILCKYKDVEAELMNARKKDLFPGLPNDGIYTGHHLIADHCFYVTFGVRGGTQDLLIKPNYTEGNAPVVIVTADSNGGKSREHGQVHLSFDPAEEHHTGAKQWTYAQARAAAVASVQCLGIDGVSVATYLDAYFKIELGFNDNDLIRAGERSVFPGYEPRRSARTAAADGDSSSSSNLSGTKRKH